MVLIAICLGLFAAGCDYQPILGEYRFLQPDKPIAKLDQAQVNWIIQDMGELDKSDEVYSNATKPGPQDWVYVDEDYVIAPMDDLQITVMDLYFEGGEAMLQRKVSDSGYINLPQLEAKIMAAGFTGEQLTEKIKEAYSKNFIRDPQVSIAVVGRRQQTFSVLGAVGNPGTFPFPRKNLRLFAALAWARGVFQQDIETIYVIRQAPALRKSEAGPLPPASQPAGNSKISRSKVVSDPSRRFLADTLSRSPLANQGPLYQLTETAQTLKTAPASTPVPEASVAPASSPETESTYRWIYKDGEWVKVENAQSPPTVKPIPTPTSHQPEVAPTPPTSPVTEADPEDPFGWKTIEKSGLVRVIAINLPKLMQGDSRQNIVIRSNDIIHVPRLPEGEFYIFGEVFRPGVYSLAGRKVTIRMALAAAGNLSPLAWPSNAMLTRRIGKNQEQNIPINIEKILRGTAPDMYLKKDDVLAIGTHWSTSFLAVLRNAFRMTYGFGFIYDRNFSDPMFATPSSRRFKEW